VYRGVTLVHIMEMPTTIHSSLDGFAAEVERLAHETLVEAYVMLVEGTKEAVTTLVYTAANGKDEEARVQAARHIIDLAGLSPEVRVSVSDVSEHSTRIIELRGRLSSMREGLTSPIETTSSIKAPEADTA
jgi:hypothetical protein